jgi:glycosyltransferase involved in cell wall biosynthesis
MGRAYEALAGISNRQIDVIPNGIDRKVFYPAGDASKRELRRSLGLPADGPLAISVCSVIPRKGVDLLVEAWKVVLAKHPNATLAIVGSDFVRPTLSNSRTRNEVSAFIDRIRSEIAGMKRPDSVILTGEVDNVQDYYRAADLFVFASLKEGLPSAVLEAMSSGLPSVLAPFHGFPGPGEEYGHPETHFIPATHDPNSIADGVVRLIESPSDRYTMGSAAAQWIEETQGMDRATDLLVSIYRSKCPRI